ncbi:type I DNA topoisomerase [Paludibacter sp. 221]|uniref:type I DNA topoisomerase n=1 Tax=Paludibacter sp. 221 TaxID=2302939 RepID=UPI0013D88130|nr:type I DNA topoisomerase [Paludibacter sp. 221]NDV46407.1 type I DNA topoisomerase [Paludibacter sp. 221]
MSKNLVIVESPAKAKTIEKFLGKNFHVMSSFGHVRDLPDKGINIDFENNYTPKYEVSKDKKKIVTELKKAVKEADIVWLASDEDREGEAIAWHLYEELGLEPDKTRRIVFHEITKDAILKSIEHPRSIDINLVNAQQARRVLDRIVGFELSPVLWRKVRPSLSAGRVQSVAVRLIVEREREVQNFKPEASYRVNAVFTSVDKDGHPVQLKAELNNRFSTKAEALKFLELCQSSDFNISDIEKKPIKKTPAPPFTTSTLQQEASRKLGFSVAQTMSIAQRLYEEGNITYMRTDSVNLSDLALNTSKSEIISMVGEKYVKIRKFTTKSKGAQEAHEAIRPTYMNKHSVGANANEKRLYELIWKRTIASQMADAELEKTIIHIDISGSKYQFITTGEVIVFDGFLNVYIESTDDEPDAQDESLLPAMKKGEKLSVDEVVAQQRFSQHPPRYTEASLVRKLEELGIGRPSTYAPTISTIQQRKYVEKENRQAEKREYNLLTLKKGKITDQTKLENYGAEKSKLFPTDIGMVVTDFLIEYFPNILNYNFTANVEKEFDHIAEGDIEWTASIDKFYKDFHPLVEDTIKNSERQVGERILGTDPKTGRQLSVKIGKYGPIAQIGTVEEEEKPTFASLLKTQSIETISYEEALKLFEYPRSLGEYENEDMQVAIGRFGPYIRHKGKFYSLPKTDEPGEVTAARAIEIIEEKREVEKNRLINSFGENDEIQVLNGRFGPYISFEKNNYKIPKDTDPKSLTEEQIRAMIKEQMEDGGKKKKRTPAKKKK